MGSKGEKDNAAAGAGASQPPADDVDSNGSVFKVSVRAPPFYPAEPALWFSQMEAQFEVSGITTESTKYNYIVSQLEQQYVLEVKDIITNPPAINRYTKLKTELISRLSASQEKRVLQLMKHEELGERKPSQLLRHLRTLAGKTVTDDFLKTVWSSRLPSGLQTLIASQTSATMEELADLADKVHDIAPQMPQVCAVGGDPYAIEMAKQMANLAREVASLKANFENQSHSSRSCTLNRYRGRSRTPSSGRRRDRSASRNKDPSVCWYHNRFGDKSTRCTRPCSYPGSENFDGSRK
ncbi:uncharacterized protein LOC125235797 [Leguminivora glycinivorella]|uniref:uncharacterized protein LOC125235797 n=1 Tax=Leguminivora glycinivorella TaxID=1035111 RepID=UPI00201068FD|nr:uncharacterized protein LOC125235797 [Leguminivora glycinivorella]